MSTEPSAPDGVDPRLAELPSAWPLLTCLLGDAGLAATCRVEPLRVSSNEVFVVESGTGRRASTYELLMAVWRARATTESGQRFDWPDSQAGINYLQDRSNLLRLHTLLQQGS